jgi:hypothetical protein
MSALVELALVRNRRKEKRFGPGPANNYTSGSGSKRGRGLFGFGRKRHTDVEDTNALPAHAHPDDVRDSYATEQTGVGSSYGDGTAANGTTYPKHGEAGYAAPAAVPAASTVTDHAYYTAPHMATVNPYRSEPNSGVTGGGLGTSVHDTAPARDLTGNHRYEDGVYNSRA